MFNLNKSHEKSQEREGGGGGSKSPFSKTTPSTITSPQTGGLARVIIISLFATLACVGIIKAATTIGNNISTTGTLTVGDSAIFSTASSTGIVKFSQINSDTGAISFGDENLSTTGTLNITGLTTLGNASTTLLSVSDSLIITGDLSVNDGTTRIAGTASEGQTQSTATNIASIGGETHYTDLTGTIRAGLHNATYIDVDLTKEVWGLYTYAEGDASSMAGNANGAVIGARINAAHTGSGTLYNLTGSFSMAEIYGNQGTPIVSNGRSIVGQLLFSSTDYNATMTDYRGLYLYSQKIDAGNTLSGTNWYQMYVSDFVDFGGTTTNKYGLWMENIGTTDAPTTNRMGIVLDGNGNGSNIVFGDSQQISMSRNSSSGYLDVKENGIDVWNNFMRLGSDGAANTRTENTTKSAYLVAPHKCLTVNCDGTGGAEEDIVLIGQSQTAAHNTVSFGGGHSGLNSATKMRFYTSATNNVLAGTQRLMITETGNFMFGPTSDLIGTNAVNVLGIQNGTAPSTSIADGVQIWAADYAANDSRLNIMSEANATDKLTLGAGRIVTMGADPVISSCGTSPSIIGSDMAGKITIGTGTITSCTITFAKAYTTNAPACTITGDNSAVTYAATTTTSALTIASSADMASDAISFICAGL